MRRNDYIKHFSYNGINLTKIILTCFILNISLIKATLSLAKLDINNKLIDEDELCQQCQSTVLLYKYKNKIFCFNPNQDICTKIESEIKKNYDTLRLISTNSLKPCNICFRLSLCHISSCDKVNLALIKRLSSILNSKYYNFKLVNYNRNSSKEIFELYNMIKNKTKYLLSEIKKLLLILYEVINMLLFQKESITFIMKNNMNEKSSILEYLKHLSFNQIKKYISNIINIYQVVNKGIEEIDKKANRYYLKLNNIKNNKNINNEEDLIISKQEKNRFGYTSNTSNADRFDLFYNKKNNISDYYLYLTNVLELEKKITNLELLYTITNKFINHLLSLSNYLNKIKL